MAAGPGVSMQSGSPARELSLSVQPAGNQTHGERIKPEESTGEEADVVFCFGFCFIVVYSHLVQLRLTTASS